MKRRRVVILAVVATLVLTGAAILFYFDPTETIGGWLAGEPFYHRRPLRYWRELLRSAGREGNIPPTTAARFWDVNEAFPVLEVCARDPDRNVRWPAINLVQTLRTQAVLDLLIRVLDDEDPEVRIQAIHALHRWGPAARAAFEPLSARLQDPEMQVAHWADQALWRIDPLATSQTWARYTDMTFGVSVMLPGPPERKSRPLVGGAVNGHTLEAWHRAGAYQSPTRYIVLMIEYPEELLKESTEEQRYKALKDTAPDVFGGRVTDEADVAVGDIRGRAFTLEVPGMGRIWSRSFWLGRKMVAIQVVNHPDFVNTKAAEYFLDSLQFER